MDVQEPALDQPSDRQRAAVDALFAATPEQLGQAAVEGAMRDQAERLRAGGEPEGGMTREPHA